MKRPTLISIIAILHFIFDPILILAGAVLVFGVDSAPDERAMEIVMGAVLLLMALVGFVGAVGLWQRKAYGRNIQIGLSVFGLLAFPMGTIINGLLLWYLYTPAVKVLFSGKRTDQLTDQEALALQQSGGGGAPVVVVLVIGFFVAIGVIGIMAAIAIPNLLTAMQRSKQKRTVADMRTIAVTIEQYAIDNKRFPEADDIDALKNQVAQYASVVSSDGWAQPIRYGTDGENYWLISAGKDGQFQTENPREYEGGEVANFDCDIVFVNGEFVQYPEGTAR